MYSKCTRKTADDSFLCTVQRRTLRYKKTEEKEH